ncbi:hypothetical protein NEIFL0001_0974 [Neisseria flavescens SK114]|nr:hypothetical protein NEIFL0001_0974 [Neisseria flavescens SK114]
MRPSENRNLVFRRPFCCGLRLLQNTFLPGGQNPNTNSQIPKYLGRNLGIWEFCKRYWIFYF